jgi:5'-3' exoribonuclease 1
MTNEKSPMISDYPEEFGIDMDGKKNPWEAVVLLGFIDEKRLFEAETQYCKTEMLTEDELSRNKFGAVLTHRFDPKVFTTYYSCNPEIGLPDITKCQSEVTLSHPDLKPGASFKPELVPGTITPIAGFPSLTVLQISKVDIDFYKTNVFGTESKYRTLVLEIFSQKIDIEKVDLKTLLGRLVYVNYPMMHEAKVVGITTSVGEYRLINNDEEVSFMKYDLVSSEMWKKEAALESLKYLKGRTTPGSSGLDIGDIQIRLRVQALQGMKRDPLTGASKKVYNTSEADVPIQLALWTATTIDPRFQEQDEVPVEKLMPFGCNVVAVVGPLRGCLGTVVGPHTAEDSKKLPTNSTSSKRRVVDVEFSIPPAEPPFGHLIADSIKDEYFSSQDVCTALKIPPNVLGKIAGSVIIDKEDLGLTLKRNGHFQLLG